MDLCAIQCQMRASLGGIVPRTRGMALSVAARDRIDELDDGGVGAKAIQEAIEQEVAKGDLLDKPAPSLRTVQRYLAQRPERDRSPWSLGADRTGDPAPVLDALEAAIYSTKGRIRAVTIAEAGMVARIARATDYTTTGLPAPDLWRLARLYVARAARSDNTVDLDAFLALRPWKSPDDWQQYLDRVNAKWIPGLPPVVLEMLTCGLNLGEVRGEGKLEEHDRAWRALYTPVSSPVSSSE